MDLSASAPKKAYKRGVIGLIEAQTKSLMKAYDKVDEENMYAFGRFEAGGNMTKDMSIYRLKKLSGMEK